MKSKFIFVVMMIMMIPAFIRGAEPMLEFGPSVTFDKDDPAIKMSDLKGKVVLVVFFQSWCPICNKWSGEKFKKVEDAFANDRSVVLVALKTDGGGVSGAKSYLKDRVNLDNWIVGTDNNAEYYVDVNGKDELFRYALVNGKGELVEKGFFSSGSLPTKKFSTGFFTKTFFAADAKYPYKLSKVVKSAELGFYKDAILESRKMAKDKEVSDEAKTLEKDIFARLKEKISEFPVILKDEKNPDRFTNYLELRHMAEALQGIAIQNDALIILNEFKSDPFYKKELSAETAYLNYKKNLTLIKKSELNKYKETFLPKFLENYQDTYYGAIAKKEEEAKK